MSVYLDCNATTPIDPRVQEEVLRYLSIEFGNAGSRTHEFGQRAKQAVQRARDQVADVVKCERDEVVFTSGATESNNLAILGLEQYGETSGRRHIVGTMIEHKAVLEPLSVLAQRGFEISLAQPTSDGSVDPSAIRELVRKDTLLVSVMHVNNETGVVQSIGEIADILIDHPTFFHVDAAQSFGKDLNTLQNPRLDMISISGHKIFGPKGVGALVVRRRGFSRLPLTPLLYGGGQERGLRPGTLPVPLIVGLGLAAELATQEHQRRAAACRIYRQKVMASLLSLEPVFNGDPERALPHVLNFSIPGLDSEAVMVALKDLIAISNGSACTSQSYQPSHVLKAMEVPDAIIQGALRLSWCHMTEDPDWNEIVRRIGRLR